jgi:hypothetical protein
MNVSLLVAGPTFFVAKQIISPTLRFFYLALEAKTNLANLLAGTTLFRGCPWGWWPELS